LALAGDAPAHNAKAATTRLLCTERMYPAGAPVEGAPARAFD
jgi:hypothetical protein